MTEAEKRFEAIQKQRCGVMLTAIALSDEQRDERIAKAVEKTHKERVQEYNAKLEKVT